MATNAEARREQLRAKVTGWHGQAVADQMMSYFPDEARAVTVTHEQGADGQTHPCRKVQVWGGIFSERDEDAYFMADVEAAQWFRAAPGR